MTQNQPRKASVATSWQRSTTLSHGIKAWKVHLVLAQLQVWKRLTSCHNQLRSLHIYRYLNSFVFWNTRSIFSPRIMLHALKFVVSPHSWRPGGMILFLAPPALEACLLPSMVPTDRGYRHRHRIAMMITQETSWRLLALSCWKFSFCFFFFYLLLFFVVRKQVHNRRESFALAGEIFLTY